MNAINHFVLIFFQDPPGPPGTPKCVTTTPDSITLSWTPPKKDGGNPVRGYIVERRGPDDDRWVK